MTLIEKALELKKRKCISLYFDTDSYTGIAPHTNFKIESSNQLNEWKLEKIRNKKEGIDTSFYDTFIYLAPKHYRMGFINSAYPSKTASAGVNKYLMSKIPNHRYNYNLQLDKNTLSLGQHGFNIVKSEYNFVKYKGKIKNPTVPKNLRFRNQNFGKRRN